MALIAGVTLVVSYPRAAPTRTSAPQIASIAILPLVATGGEDAEIGYLADGITEDVIRRLSRVSQLKVIARDSVYRYAGKDHDPRQAGRELGVQAVLTGRLVVSGSALTLTAELVDVRDGRQLWGERYPTKRRGCAVPAGGAGAADRQRAAGARVRGRSHARAQGDSVDPDVYRLYLRGRYFLNKRTPDDLKKSAGYFQQAVDKEPAYARAYAGLADAYGLLTEYHVVSARDTYTPVKNAAMRALALDDDLAEAHTSLAYFKQFYEWDWPAAEAEFKRALALDPRYGPAHQWYAEYLSTMGRHDEALAEIERGSGCRSSR